VDTFNRQTDAYYRIIVEMEQIAGCLDEQRPQALAATHRGMTHGFVQAAARVIGYGQQVGEREINSLAHHARGTSQRNGIEAINHCHPRISPRQMMLRR
jgi:hypothetical protein